jgi:RNA polymerase sigma-70 factor, ECF subfamily
MMEEKQVRVEPWSPEETAERAARGDTEAFGTLYERLHGYVEHTALGVVRNPQDAEDVAQNVWAKLMSGLGNYTPQARFTTWLYRVVTYAAIDHARKRRRDTEMVDPIQVGDEPALTPAVTSQLMPLDQESAYLHDRIAAEIDRAARALDESNSVRGNCFRMYYLGEMTIRDISDALRLSEGTVKSHLFYCRRYIAENHPVLGDLHLALEERLGKSNGTRMY